MASRFRVPSVRRIFRFIRNHVWILIAFLSWEALYGFVLPDLQKAIGPIFRFFGVMGVCGLAVFSGWRSVLWAYPLFLIYHLWLHRLHSLPWVQGVAGPLLGGSFCLLLGFAAESYKRARDSERRLAESLGALAQALDQRSRFLATAGHEIRTPLNAISGYTQVLMHETKQGTALEGLNNIDRAVRHLTDLVTNIMDLAQAETGILTTNPQPQSISTVIQDILDFHKKDASEKRLDLEISQDSSIPDQLLVDPMRLTQVLSNLIGNAIKYTPSGKVRVTTKLIGIDPELGMARVEFRVTDTGIGISEDHHKLLFDPFFQVEEGKNSGQGSVGLGLSIANHVARSMGSHIDVHSKPGNGSTFSIVLELPVSSDRPAPGKVQGPLLASQSCTVWIADDNEANLLVLTRMLETLGYAVRSFNDGADIVDELSNDDGESPDAIILDAHMTHLSGPETALAIDSLNEFVARIPRVLLTADTTSPLYKQFKAQDSFAALLFKPVDLGDLATTLAELCSKRAAKEKAPN